MEEHNEKFNKELRKYYNKSSLVTRTTEVKNKWKGISRRLDDTEKWISDSEIEHWK